MSCKLQKFSKFYYGHLDYFFPSLFSSNQNGELGIENNFSAVRNPFVLLTGVKQVVAGFYTVFAQLFNDTWYSWFVKNNNNNNTPHKATNNYNRNLTVTYNIQTKLQSIIFKLNCNL